MNILYKIVGSKYLSRWIVLAIDSFVSAFATLSVFLVLAFFVRSTAPLSAFVLISILSLVVTAITFALLGIHKGIMRHTTIYEVTRIFAAILVKSTLLLVIFLIFRDWIGFTLNNRSIIVAQGCDVVASLFILVSLRMFLIFFYEIYLASLNKTSRRVFIYGDESQSVAVSTYLSKNLHAEYRVLGYIIMQSRRTMLKLQGLAVYTIDDYSYFKHLVQKKGINAIVFPSQHSAMLEKDRLIDYCIKSHIKVYILPQLNIVPNGGKITNQIREINVEDLLGREEIKINMQEIGEFLCGKNIMVTGGAGSIGSELVRLISSFDIKQLEVLDNAETPLHNIQIELLDREQNLLGDKFSMEEFENKFKFVIGDVRGAERMDRVFNFYRPDIVFHAAAYKHVPMMEANPCEAVKVNVFGTKNIADCAVKYGTEKVVMVSTDKAVNPTNVMGCSKRLAEIYVQTLSKAILSKEVEGKTKFITTRFGNVLGSNGSVIPRFKEQIINGGPVTVTHKDIIRFFMTIPEACRLVLEAATMGEGYEIFVFDMGKPVRIADLARKMISLAGFEPGKDIKIEYTGLRPGEKLYEEVLNNKETTLPTSHSKISVARVRNYKLSDIIDKYAKLKDLAMNMEKEATVLCMKEIVPEFISKNSIYCNLDK